MGFPLLVAVAMTMRVLVSMAVVVAFGLSRSMTAKVVMVMPMGWRCDGRLRNATLFANLRLLRHCIVVFVATPLGMGHESFQRGLIHVA